MCVLPVLLFVAFIAVPLLELWVILQVGDLIGALPTIVLLVVDSLVGAWLVRREGRRAWQSLRSAFASGQWPADEVTQGALIIFGGALLLTPGFVTDVLGLLSVLPPTRAMMSALLRRWTTAWASRRMSGSSRRTIFTTDTSGPGSRSSGRPSGSGGATRRRRRPANDPSRSSGDDPARGSSPPDVEVLSVEREDPDDPAGD